MDLLEDIVMRIRRDFSEADAAIVAQQLAAAQRKDPEIYVDRVLRCIVFAAAGRRRGVDHYIYMALKDFRDVIVAGEYDRDWNQVRDLTRPFED